MPTVRSPVRTKVDKESVKKLQHAQDYAVLLHSVNTYEQLLKEEGWGEPRNQKSHLANLAKFCGLQMPEDFLAKEAAESKENEAREEARQEALKRKDMLDL